MKKTLIAFLFGVFTFGFISSASADSIELKLATFEPPKAFIADKILAAWAEKVNMESGGELEAVEEEFPEVWAEDEGEEEEKVESSRLGFEK